MPYNKTFIMPSVPEDAPEGLKKMLSSVYSNNRQKWVKENPDDPENKENKKSSAAIAWDQVKKFYKKNPDGKWVEKEKSDNFDSSYCHEVIVRDPDDFEGGTFKDFDVQGINGVWGQKGRLNENGMEDTQRLMFSINQFSIKQVKDYLDKNKIEYKKIIEAKEDQSDDIKEYFLHADFLKTDSVETKTIQHFDILDDTTKNLTTKMVQCSDGSLEGKPIVTNIGVFLYKQSDGTILRELRCPEEVFAQDSLNTLKSIPITNSHPDPKKHASGLVNRANKADLQVGITGNDVNHDAYAVSVSCKINDKETVKDVKSGKDMLSCGYEAVLDFSPGNFLGIPYDAIQRNIRYNHIAAVTKARAGDLAKMRFDSGDAILTEIAVGDDNYNKQGEYPMKKITLDGVEYEAEAKVIEAYTIAKADADDLKKKNEDLKTENSKLAGERDSFKDEAEKAKKDLAGKVITDEMISSAVEERLDIVSVANELKVETKKDGKELSNEDLKKAIVIKKYPTAKFDGKDSVYINARYDALVDTMKDEVVATNKKKIFGDNIPSSQSTSIKKDGDNKPLTRKDAYEKQTKNLEDRHLEYKGAISKE